MTIDWQLPELRTSTYPTPDDLAERRAGIAAMPLAERAPGIDVREATIGGVPCIVCAPPDPDRTVVYFHGGGFRLGSPTSSTPFATRMAAALSARVVVVTYRLAPEHPFPAGLHDATAVYAAVVDDTDGPVVAAGDSAGGGLAASLTVACVAAGVPTPAALLLMSPWVDLTHQADSYATKGARDILFSLAAATEASEMYLQGHDAADPLASPLFAELDPFPPTLVLASTDEVLLDDSVSLVGGLARAGVESRASFQPGVHHAWPAVFPAEPPSAAALDKMARFLTEVGA